MYLYFKKDTKFASDLYVIYYGCPCKSLTDRLLILYLLLTNAGALVLEIRSMISNDLFQFLEPLSNMDRSTFVK